MRCLHSKSVLYVSLILDNLWFLSLMESTKKLCLSFLWYPSRSDIFTSAFDCNLYIIGHYFTFFTWRKETQQPSFGRHSYEFKSLIYFHYTASLPFRAFLSFPKLIPRRDYLCSFAPPLWLGLQPLTQP